jgi:hypothetical protein
LVASVSAATLLGGGIGTYGTLIGVIGSNGCPRWSASYPHEGQITLDPVDRVEIITFCENLVDQTALRGGGSSRHFGIKQDRYERITLVSPGHPNMRSC